MIEYVLPKGLADPERRSHWLDYWHTFWNRTPDWSAMRLNSFMTATQGRVTHYMPHGQYGDEEKEPRVIQSPVVYDLPDGKGAFIGVLPTPKEAAGVLQFNEPGHLLTIAPTRTGKGACHVIPNLLLYAGSIVVVDIKGENHEVTAAYRASMLEGARVYRFAPFQDDTHCYNPLDFVRSLYDGGPTVDTIDDARLVAEMLVPGKSHEPFWDMEARNIVTMLIAYVASVQPAHSSNRTMAEVVRLLFRSDGPTKEEKFDLTIKEISAFAKEHQFKSLLALANAFEEHEDKLRDNILSSCRTDLGIWTNERLQAVTGHSDFRFPDLKESMCVPVELNPAPTTLYIIIPPEYLLSYQPLVRLMIGLGVTELTRKGRWEGVPGWRRRPPGPVLFLLDELPSLGYMQPIVNGLTYLAGYDIKLWSFAQNIGQLKEIYRDAWHNFPANSAVTCFFGVNDLETAEFVSRQLGDTEEEIIAYDTRSRTDGQSSTYNSGPGSTTTSSSSSLQEHQRVRREALARPSDVRSSHGDLQYVFIRNRPPILATKLSYYNFPLLERFDGTWQPASDRSP